MSDALAHYCFTQSSKIKLDQFDPGANPYAALDQAAVDAQLAKLTRDIGVLQNQLYAEHQRKLLVVFQGMDASGKDGAIRAAFIKTHPLGLRSFAFKAPAGEEATHDYLWRVHRVLPSLGEIGVFNRSHYEAVLAERILGLIDQKECKSRYAQINDFERMLSETGTTIIKFFLHISKDEQKRRIEDRQQTLEKQWKFNVGDLDARAHWKDYQEAYTRVLRNTATTYAPWWVVPADSKMHRNLMVATIVHATLQQMAPTYPKLSDKLKKILVK